MSEKQTISSSSNQNESSETNSKVNPTTVGLTSKDEDIFALAAKMEALLKGKSNKTCLKVMNMVGSLHGIRAISSDRPIGLSQVGVTRVTEKPKKAKKGKPTPPAAWKQTEDYRLLSEKRSKMVDRLKSLPADSPDKDGAVEALREIERELKDLKSPTAGNH